MSAAWCDHHEGMHLFDCELEGGGRSVREGVLCQDDRCQALLGAATFPIWIPRLAADETAFWRPLKGWIIRKTKPRRARRATGVVRE